MAPPSRETAPHNLTLPVALVARVRGHLQGKTLSALVGELLEDWCRKTEGASAQRVPVAPPVAKSSDTPPPIWHHASVFGGGRWMLRLPPTTSDEQVIEELARVVPGGVAVIQRSAAAVTAWADPADRVARYRAIGLWRPVGVVVDLPEGT